MSKLVLASGNPGKVREFRRLLAPLGFELLAQNELDMPEAEEPHVTFVENALVKARHASAHAGLPALADDSGICVDALSGQPGVLSARYAGYPKSDQRNNQRLLAELETAVNRDAHYYCVLVFVRRAEDPEPIIAEGVWQGEILHQPRGNGGFGYDPLFLDVDSGLSGAELPLELKNERSHRGKALRDLIAKLKQRQRERLHPLA